MKYLHIIFLKVFLIPFITNASVGNDTLMMKVIALEKEVMQNNNDTVVAHLLIKKAEVYKQLNTYTGVIATLNRVALTVLPDTLQEYIHYQKALSYFMLTNYQKALFELWNINFDNESKQEYKLLYLMTLLENERWADFNQEYIRQKSEQKIQTEMPVLILASPAHSDPEYYAKLSKRFPGLGLMKSHHYGKGLTSLSIQVLFIGFAIYNFSAAYYATGLLSGIMPARKFYFGGILLTRSMIEIKNQESIAECKQEGYQLISTIF